MLTLDLLRTYTEGGRIRPRFVDIDSTRHLGVAQDLIDIVGIGVNGRRRQMQERLDEYAGDRVDYRVQRGLTKLLLDDDCRFEVTSSMPPSQLRRAIFTAARRSHPIVSETDLFHGGDRQRVLDEVASELDIPVQQIDTELYADLVENHVVVSFDPPEATALLQRYNVALAQAMLYRCRQLRITIDQREPVRVRQLFSAIKLNRLIHVTRRHDHEFHLTLDGPVSLLRHSQRYGIRMAAFLPCLFEFKSFQLEADVADPQTTGRPSDLRFELDATQGLVSHRRTWAEYDSKVESVFARRFEKLNCAWRLQRETAFIDLKEAVMIPDFAFHHDDGRMRLLEIVGYWRPEYLARKLNQLREAGRQDLMVAVSERLKVSRDEVEELPGQVIWFKGRLEPKAVLARLEA